MKVLNMEEAVQQLQMEKIIAYPTETFYAVGGLALSPKACKDVFTAKQREGASPLPVIIGPPEQLPLLTKNISNAELDLIIKFWPGPLSVLFKAGPLLPAELLCNSPEVAIRQTPHNGAAELCRLAGPLSASSANLSGEPPITDPYNLAGELKKNIAGVADIHPMPLGGKPSTLVRVLEHQMLQVLRFGAITKEDFEKEGWEVVG